jgi:S1-C subfamily serine protease
VTASRRDGSPIAGIEELSTLITSSRPGDTIEIGVDRAGENLTLTATLGSR